MTRINAGIAPSKLSREHLLAELREIKRIPNQISRGKYSMKGQPSEFTLGTGHVKFFYDKCGYLLKRYRALHAEGLERGYNIQDFSGAWDGVPELMMGDYTPTAQAIKLIEERIRERTK